MAANTSFPKMDDCPACLTVHAIRLERQSFGQSAMRTAGRPHWPLKARPLGLSAIPIRSNFITSGAYGRSERQRNAIGVWNLKQHGKRFAMGGSDLPIAILSVKSIRRLRGCALMRI